MMTLAKFSNNWFPSMPSLFERFFEGDMMDWNTNNFAGKNSTLPAVNVKETDNDFNIEVAAPGMQKDDFKISYENGRLSISAETKSASTEGEGEKLTRHEFNYSSFQRSFAVSETAVETDKIAANYKDGILAITLPKREEVKPKPAKQIAIN